MNHTFYRYTWVGRPTFEVVFYYVHTSPKETNHQSCISIRSQYELQCAYYQNEIKCVLLAEAQHRRLHSAFGWG